MRSLERILELVNDSKWHSIEEIEREVALPSDTLDIALGFLEEQAFIDRENKKLKITPVGLKLLELPS